MCLYLGGGLYSEWGYTEPLLCYYFDRLTLREKCPNTELFLARICTLFMQCYLQYRELMFRRGFYYG